MGNIIRSLCKECEEPPMDNTSLIVVPRSPTVSDKVFVGTIEEYIYYSNSPKIR